MKAEVGVADGATQPLLFSGSPSPSEVVRSTKTGLRPPRMALVGKSVPALANLGPAAEPDPSIATGDSPAFPHDHSTVSAVLVDAAAVLVAAAVAAVIQTFVDGDVSRPSVAVLGRTSVLVYLFVTVPVLTTSLAATHARRSLRRLPGQHLAGAAPALAIGGFLSIAILRITSTAGLSGPTETSSVLVACALGLLSITLGRVGLEAAGARGSRGSKRILIVGSGVVAGRVAERMTRSGGAEIVGFLDDDPMDRSQWVGKLKDLPSVCRREQVDHILVAFSRASNEKLMEAIRPVHGRVPITVVPRLFDMLPSTSAIWDLGSGLTGISVLPASLGRGPRLAKRAMDVAGAAGLLLLLSPVLIAVALAIRLTSPGPVLFRQDRIGSNEDRFRMIKFRSMRVDAALHHPSAQNGQSVDGPFPKLKNDPRVTAVGRIIRRTSIDELPQLLNVLKGEMSLVGPRPFIPEDSAWIEGWSKRRYSVRPGITGLWQVSGRNDITFEDMCRLDNFYVSSWSVGLDLRILLKTLRAVVARDGAY